MFPESHPDLDPDLHPDARVLVRLAVLAPLAVLTVLAAGCRQDRHDLAKYEPREAAPWFSNGASARVPPAGTIARGTLAFHAAAASGGKDRGGTYLAELPVPLDRALLLRGRERFEIFCAPCHDRAGTGHGMIVQRGFKQPPSYHEQRLREAPVGYLYDVASNGFGQMSGYKAQASPADRWAIAAWIRVLQRSQSAPFSALPAEQRELVRRSARAGAVRAAGQAADAEQHR